jgi:hypothetical protein
MAKEILQIYVGVMFLFPIVAMKLVLTCCMSFACGLMQKTWKVQSHLMRIWSFYNNMLLSLD